MSCKMATSAIFTTVPKLTPMLGITELKPGKKIMHAGEPFEILKADFHKMAQSKAVMKVKMRNLLNGAVLDHTFSGSDKAKEADLELRPATFLYKEGTKAVFMDAESFDQFDLAEDRLGTAADFLTENADTEVLMFAGKAVSVQLPFKMDFTIVSCPPGIKGDTATGGTKEAVLETGAKVQVPLFLNAGDRVRVNTQTGEYVERA